MGHHSTHSTTALQIDEDVCRTCRVCEARKACRYGAILIIERGEAPVIDMSQCRGCLACMWACPYDAVVRRKESQ